MASGVLVMLALLAAAETSPTPFPLPDGQNVLVATLTDVEEWLPRLPGGRASFQGRPLIVKVAFTKAGQRLEYVQRANAADSAIHVSCGRERLKPVTYAIPDPARSPNARGAVSYLYSLHGGPLQADGTHQFTGTTSQHLVLFFDVPGDCPAGAESLSLRFRVEGQEGIRKVSLGRK